MSAFTINVVTASRFLVAAQSSLQEIADGGNGAQQDDPLKQNFTLIAANAARIGALCEAMIPLCQEMQAVAWREQQDALIRLAPTLKVRR